MLFDYVVVGGGSAGATLAARLSDDAANSVCLIEAGGTGDGTLVRIPAAGVAMVTSKINNWAYASVPQPAFEGRRSYQPRGRCLGGSSAINAMVYIRGDRRDYDAWAAQGADGWSYRDVLPYFQRAERNVRGGDAYHGDAGPLHVADVGNAHPISRAFIAACGERGIIENPDFNGATQAGAGPFQVTQFHDGPRAGERCSAAAAYLMPARSRPNLMILTRCHAERLLFDGRRAVGVRYRTHGAVQEVRARREVILAAGTFNSPHLLMLSGIGRGAELLQHGITVRHDLPGVGQNLQDHVDFVQSWSSPDHTLPGFGVRGGWHVMMEALRWLRHRKGLLGSPYAEAGAFVRSEPGLSRADLELQFVIAIEDDHGRKMHWGHGFSCHAGILRPYTRGEVGLSNADPMAPPRIDPRYLSDPRDMALLIKGARLTREILTAPALAPYRKAEIYTHADMTDDDLAAHIRARADTNYHAVGTCRMGRDAKAVVDPSLRVHGIDGLRVADASIMPTLIGGNTNAAAIMIGEKAADLINGWSIPSQLEPWPERTRELETIA